MKYLEIGCFEGRSTVYVGEHENIKKITAVDTFKGSDELDNLNINFDLVYENFKSNMNLLGKKNINIIKDNSDNFFDNNSETYNLIFLDGSHDASYVKRDLLNSLDILEKEGVLIIDDFLWLFYEDFYKNPINVIIGCYERISNELEIIHLHNLIIFKKK